MKTFILHLILAVFSVVLYAGPEIEVIGRTKADFGKYPAKLKKEFSFKIKNKGNEPLKITRIRNTCACADVEIGKKELDPGDVTELKGAVRADSIYGKYDKKIYIQSNAANEKFLSLAIAGNAIPILKVKPDDKLYIGKVTGTWEKTFILEPTEKNVEIGKIAVKGTHQYYTVLKKQDDGNYQLKTTLKPSDKPGQIKSVIEIPVIKPTGWEPVKIMLQGRTAN